MATNIHANIHTYKHTETLLLKPKQSETETKTTKTE